MAEASNGTAAAPVGESLAGAPPDLEFAIESVRFRGDAAAPTLVFDARATEGSGTPVYTIALSTLFTIEPGKRRYGEDERERLVELFGEPERWAATTGSFRWAQVGVLVPSFTGETTFEIELPCTYDHEIAATKYLGGIGEGAAPLQLHFNGTVFYAGAEGRLQVVPLPWDLSVRHEMPVDVWREMMARHYPEGDWVRVSRGTLERLRRRKAETGSATFDALVAGMLDSTEDGRDA